MKKKTQSPKQEMQRRIKKKKIIKGVLIGLVTVMVIGTVYLGVMVFQQVSGFSKEKLLSSESSTQIVSGEEKEYYTYGSTGTRKNVAYDDIPQVMIDAVVAAEDSRFFEHNGFDLPRIVKALLGNIVAGDITGGGSTITQQVIKKSYYPKEEQTIQRKIGEVILSIEASSQVTKEEILELYLNKIYFGYGNKSIGIYAASRYYFDKEVQQLTLPEAALLAGTLNSPTAFDPFRNLDKAQSRRDTILYLMKEHGYISEEEYETTKAIPVENTLKSNPLSGSGVYQAYADMVTREVIEETGMDPEETSMRIYTYMDTELQSKLNDISTGKSFKFPDKYLKMGACVQESGTGRVTGIISNRDYEALGISYAYAADKELVKENQKKGNYSFNYGQRNQPGSSLKPIISYASAFEFLNYSTAHYVHDVPFSSAGWTPQNWNQKYHGDISITEALAKSWNLAAIQTMKEVTDKIGYDKMTSFLEGFGFDMYNEKLGLTYAIGGWDTGITPQEQAGAYAAISNGGTYIKPHAVEKIEIISTGEVIYLDEKAQKEKKQALSEESAFMIRDVMVDYTKGGSSGYGNLNIGYEVGAKSGTSNYPDDYANKKIAGKNKDLWVAAFSPSYSWSVWVGYDQEGRDKNYYPTGYTNYKLSALIGKYAHEGKEKKSYPEKPESVVKSQCISGLYPYVSPGSNVPSNRIVSGWFKKDNTPSGSASAAALNNLTSFTAAVSGNKVTVDFAPYDPISMTKSSTPTKAYKIGNREVTLPYFGDPNQIFGKVVYAVDILDANGTVIHSEKLNTNTATLNYNLPSGSYTVNGYYAFENASTTSNKLSQTLTVDGATSQPASYTVTGTTVNSITVGVVVPSGSSVTIALSNGATQKVTSSGQVIFSQLNANTEYTISGAEITSAGLTNLLTPQVTKTLAQ